ncbi:hypothetical protein [Rubrobacter indicoceani]|uniref:TubC N-terminal docking domain-related protein n=1 Tax=Rubrobacter indicoceani TaxID=2051957 RepID=UPI001F09DA45|nr:hypothetical protein [Rubrobacter indicoceani]
MLLIRRFENSGVVFGVQDGKLSVDAPSDLLTDEDIATLTASKADIVELVKRRERRLQEASERGFIATYSKVSGYVALHDPLTGEWHDFPASSCLSSVVEEAKARTRRRKERGA